MKTSRFALALWVVAACGAPSPRPAAHPEVDPVVVSPSRARATSVVFPDRVEWTVQMGTEPICFDEETCLAAGETRRTSEALQPLARFADGVVVSSDALRRFDHAQVDHETRHERVHVTPFGTRSLTAITRTPLDFPEGIGLRLPSGATLGERALSDVVREETARLRRVLGAPVHTLFITAEAGADAPASEGIVTAERDDTALDLRAKLITAWLGALPTWDGVAHYLALRIDALDEDTLLDQWLLAYREYRAHAGVAPNDGSARTVPGGIVAALCADVELHDAETSLLAEVRHARDTPPTLPGPVAEQLEVRLSFTGVIDVGPCLTPLGRELVAVRYADADPASLLRVGVDDALRVTSRRGFFRVGDVLVSVAGLTLETPSDIAWALHDTDVGDRFVVVLRRGDAILRTWARRPRTPDSPTRVQFTLRRASTRPDIVLD